MRYIRYTEYDVVNGPGIRNSLFVSGCTHKCVGCYSPESHDFSVGAIIDEDFQEKILDTTVKNKLIDGLSILGGDPLVEGNLKDTIELLKLVYPHTSVMLWTGYVFSYIVKNFPEILMYTDAIIDGRYVEKKRDLSLLYRGSSNQKIYVKDPMGVFRDRTSEEESGIIQQDILKRSKGIRDRREATYRVNI